MNGKTKIDEAKLRAEFESSETLRAEFGEDVKAYLAFRLAESQGRIRGLKSNVPVHTSSAEPGFEAGVDEESLKREFAALSADEKAEFGDVESYVAFRKAECQGRTGCRGVTSFAEAASRVKIRRDEREQYSHGVPCRS